MGKLKSKRSKATDIPIKVRDAVYDRDNGICIICKQRAGAPNMHYIPRSRGGSGIERNIACGCIKCHHDYDNGNKHAEYGLIIRKYLQSHYLDWQEKDLIYNKYK